MMEKRQPLQQTMLQKMFQKTETRSMLSPCTNINSKWIKDLKIRPKTLKLLQGRAGNTLDAIGIGKDFINKPPVA
jgi:hypothetical protein